MRYGRQYAGGADVNDAWGGGGPVVLAAASYAGNTSADARLLGQIRDTITGGNEPVAAGGYDAQAERYVTAMFALARHTPRIWNQLSTTERQKVDLIMQATLVASAFVTSDSNPYVKANAQQWTLDGIDNNRDFNPNYREGMLGGLLAGAAYYGSGSAAQAVLDAYNHATFLSQVRSAGLTNIAATYNWKADHPSDNAPTGTQIESAVHGFRYYATPLTQPMEIAWKLVSDTFGTSVGCGLNNGAGISTSMGMWGIIDSGCSSLPNKGALGQLKELDTLDGGGVRSSALYAYDSYRVDQAGHIALLASGLWSGTRTTDILGRMRIGVPDLWYKLDHGYREYSKGSPMYVPDAARDSIFDSNNPDYAIPFSRSLWEDVVKPYDGL